MYSGSKAGVMGTLYRFFGEFCDAAAFFFPADFFAKGISGFDSGDCASAAD